MLLPTTEPTSAALYGSLIAMGTDPKFIERVQRLKQAAPHLKLHMTMNHYAPVIVEKLNPYMDYWTPNSNVLITLLEDAGKGTVPIDAADQIGFYGGAWYHTVADACRVHGCREATREEPDGSPRGAAVPREGVRDVGRFAGAHACQPRRAWRAIGANGRWPESLPVATTCGEG